jgi:probable phosphoglycerate mutase
MTTGIPASDRCSEPFVLPGEVLLIRHGETEWSRSGRHTGRTDLPLTEQGRQEAGRLVPVLGGTPFARVIASPLARARQTCCLAGLEPLMEIDDDLQEWDYGLYEGLTIEEIRSRSPGWLIFRDGAPDGERPEQVVRRVDRFLAGIRHASGPVAVFSHGHLLRLLAARWIGLPAEGGGGFLLDTSTLSILSHYHGEPALRWWNAPLVPPHG